MTILTLGALVLLPATLALTDAGGETQTWAAAHARDHS